MLMKKALPWIMVISIFGFVIAWGLMGMKLLNHDYLITAEAYTGAAFLVIFCISMLLYKALQDKCPHCGKMRTSNTPFCPHCGKKYPKQ